MTQLPDQITSTLPEISASRKFQHEVGRHLPGRVVDYVLRDPDSAHLHFHAKLFADDSENGCEIVHRRIAILREHPMQTLRGLRRLGRERFESHRRIDEIAQNETSRIGLAVEEERCSLVEQCLRELRVAPNAVDDRLLEILSQCHANSPLGLRLCRCRLPRLVFLPHRLRPPDVGLRALLRAAA